MVLLTTEIIPFVLDMSMPVLQSDILDQHGNDTAMHTPQQFLDEIEEFVHSFTPPASK